MKNWLTKSVSFNLVGNLRKLNILLVSNKLLTEKDFFVVH